MTMIDSATVKLVATVYQKMLQENSECVAGLLVPGHDLKDILLGMQVAHLMIMRRNFEVLQASQPKEGRMSFDQYLKDMADKCQAVLQGEDHGI